jgi:hypothetical protein
MHIVRFHAPVAIRGFQFIVLFPDKDVYRQLQGKHSAGLFISVSFFGNSILLFKNEGTSKGTFLFMFFFHDFPGRAACACHWLEHNATHYLSCTVMENGGCQLVHTSDNVADTAVVRLPAHIPSSDIFCEFLPDDRVNSRPCKYNKVLEGEFIRVYASMLVWVEKHKNVRL